MSGLALGGVLALISVACALAAMLILLWEDNSGEGGDSGGSEDAPR